MYVCMYVYLFVCLLTCGACFPCSPPPPADNKLSEASGGAEANGEHSEDQTLDDESGAVPVDENLFTGEDLDELEDELNTLDLEEE